MGVDRGLAGPAPQDGRIRGHWRKKQAKMSIVGRVGCRLVVLRMACSQSHSKIQAPFSATPCGQFKVLSPSLVLDLV
jgi:hypothetical protein